MDPSRSTACGLAPSMEPLSEPGVQRQVCLRVGMVFQSFNLFPHRTVLQNVIEGPVYVLGINPEQADGAGAPAARRELAWRIGWMPCPGSFPAASSSEWPLLGPWPWSPR